ncbi:hypothetical protein MPTK1_3g19650 [Marchantia polymorpha subsp. ruderalis]|uniref:Uncharacterized protein n=2 Tax=Marchantia polymorpha TaxID=3197 RepID=A0AAF6B2M9_MARPO|nr:hypothetical protein MARPO_0049s0069 [Marchantia polymorpha]PTQ38786.1 hypothetical protein MARPO_0049s0069 [Marchantia polymorpha]BBN06262.1 hypothetical protein Mp_3g19650 [Marchantia polymorpha subsp. ruderalis]BBN06263.1 hypothetical protein Mp_3g19650 [Marchantia polymorpha subsp. ruderalis]|eukprot:PTQ38783.1 hypothetical protein MARPO_0049s0069 [Marchantia polymorpha]
MSSKEAPYATMHDLPTYQEREKVGSAPWEKDQRPAPSSRGPHFEPCFYPSSQTAPFATNDNLPIPRQSRKMVTSAPWDRDESHYSAKIRCGNTGSGRTAPFATEFNNNKK